MIRAKAINRKKLVAFVLPIIAKGVDPIRKHLRQLPFIVAGDAVRQHMNGVAAFRHVVAGGFDAGCDIRSNNIKICNAMFLNKSGKCLAGQGVAPTVYRQYAQYPQNQRFFITPLYVCPKRIIFAHVSVPLIGF